MIEAIVDFIQSFNLTYHLITFSKMFFKTFFFLRSIDIIWFNNLCKNVLMLLILESFKWIVILNFTGRGQ